MVTLLSQKHFQTISELPFCYWCGQDFLPGDKTDSDHVPPKSIFANSDRTPPLKLKTHIDCNQGHHLTDEKMGQLLALLYGKVPRTERQKLKRDQSGDTFAVFTLRSTANHSPWALVWWVYMQGAGCFPAATVAANPYMPAPYLVSPQAMVTVLRARGLPFAEEEIPDGVAVTVAVEGMRSTEYFFRSRDSPQ